MKINYSKICCFGLVTSISAGAIYSYANKKQKEAEEKNKIKNLTITANLEVNEMKTVLGILSSHCDVEDITAILNEVYYCSEKMDRCETFGSCLKWSHKITNLFEMVMINSDSTTKEETQKDIWNQIKRAAIFCKAQQQTRESLLREESVKAQIKLANAAEDSANTNYAGYIVGCAVKGVELGMTERLINK